MRHFGEDALKKLYQARKARHQNIVLMEFTRRLPDISDQEKIDYSTHSLDLMHSWIH
ncbi:hypothetical protein C1646_775382 [Rhizophagus diaphanus]|nr:hypothetical protein C1646_775382 [Rhizophagus diaphanus] [Rhizophagus sp. MUCL 43196]